MSKRELTPEQEYIKGKIPDFFQWHEHCQKQVEEIVTELFAYKDELGSKDEQSSRP